VATRDEVVPVLRAHGLSGLVAARLWMVARTLLRDSRRRRREYSALLHAVTGNQVGPTLNGMIVLGVFQHEQEQKASPADDRTGRRGGEAGDDG
jgi:hypothetical protein